MSDQRMKLLDLMRGTIADEHARHLWSYHAVRPMPVPSHWNPGQAVRGDCSKGVQYLCRWANLKDPMKSDYGPYGNSQTLCVSLQHIEKNDLKVGDIVTFGSYGQDHAAMVMEAPSRENNYDPLLWSFGHQGAPNSYRLSADRRIRQFRRNPVPVYVPTAADKLRAKTGWFSWVAWKLGEGDWSQYAKADPKVRPNVPRVISPRWWARYLQFLKNRKQPNTATLPVG